MKLKKILSFLIVFAITSNLFASKVISISDDDWRNALSWNNNAVPENPDTIVIRHYITFSENLTLKAPTVLIIEDGGTLCGDYLMTVLCGAKVLNHGHWYVNELKIKSSGNFNYNYFYFKTSWVISDCETGQSSGEPPSFYNSPPKGHINTWAPTLCKTAETNWLKESTGIPTNGNAQEFFVSISPNPLNSGYLNVWAKGSFELKLFDTQGALIYSEEGTDHSLVDMRDYVNGFYFVAIVYKNKMVYRKLFVEH
ncbi:T9SS type A sorting domain-containing protein [Aurantibacillus circumpalustris]|uniref:T9SS type A sorting domain-containing protein n=1 Tax=Aurantibacillus circumpalustris TaxID=3036359 RepID=UPI00295BEFCD|nr:T9SS type A sorting domain-containing protein [Aurantibacillus circumpalustris]